MPESHAPSVGSATKLCEKCGEEKPLSEFALVKRSKPWRRKSCIPCGRAYWNGWAAQNQERVKTHRKSTYVRQRDAYRILGKGASDPVKLDALRRALVEKPPPIDDDSAAVAYFRGYLAGVGRAENEAQEVEELKDLVFRIAREQDSKMRSWRPDHRLSYEDMVSIGYEALLECLRKKKKERGLVATAIRRRYQDEARERFGRTGAATAAKRDVLGRSGFEDEEGRDLLQETVAVDNVFDDTADMLDAAFRVIHDPRKRDMLARRARGETLREIGVAHDLSESRVSLLFTEMQPLLEATLLQSTP